MNRLALALFVAACSSHSGSPPDAAVLIGESVLELHGNGTRAGAYVAPAFSHAAAATLHIDSTFKATYSGNAYAQALYYDARAGGAGDLVIAATEMNEVAAFDASGQPVWSRRLGPTQAMPNAAEGAPCGDIDPLGITGTPVVDYTSKTIFLDAMIREDNAAHHRIFALSLADGTTRPGWPIDVGTAVTAHGQAFTPATQNQRGGLTVMHGHVYVPYGGHAGDCGDYHGWVVSVPVDEPAHPSAFATVDREAGAWMPGGISRDGSSVFAVFGNGQGGPTWGNGEMVARLGDDAAFSGAAGDYWVPRNWAMLDHGDVDLTGPAMPIDLPGSTPSALLFATGKDGNVYLADRSHLGGISDPVASLNVATTVIISVSAAYHTAQGTYVVVRAHGVAGCPGVTGNANLTAVKIVPGSPPKLALAWCAGSGQTGSPIATTTDGISEPIVWVIGAEGDQRLHGYDGDTGAVVFAGGGAADAVASTSRFISPMYAKGRIFVATDGALVAYTVN